MAYGRHRNLSSYQGRSSSEALKKAEKSLASYRNKTVAFIIATIAYTAFLYSSGGAGHYLGGTPDASLSLSAAKGMNSMRAVGRKLQLTTWNIAAINNNPFEYWITYNDEYEDLMKKVENFLEEPGERDVSVENVFTEEMFADLENQFKEVGWPSVQSYWDEQFKNRKIVSQFMKDPLLGSKRLASMPDRITNTINIPGQSEPICRPTVINQYDGDLSDLNKWWTEWKRFMFVKKIKVSTKMGSEEKQIYSMLKPIKKSKYPEITEQEEIDSLPLQTMCGAIFDAILVHMMNTVSEPSIWQDLKRTMVAELNRMKFPHTLQILTSKYAESDIITLQEVSSSFVDNLSESSLGQRFHIISPSNMDGVRDQNSIIMLSKESFPGGATKEISAGVTASFPPGVGVPVDKGDILAVTATHSDGVPFIVASFHGDSNGLATKPVLDALIKSINSDSDLMTHQLIFGLDANTYEKAKPNKQQSVVDWGKHYAKFNLTSCWGDVPNPANYTTFNARTYLQPQLNKACKQSDKRAKGDVNPKDFILFQKGIFNVLQTWKDNTGDGTFTENKAFPTLKFPSDHAILSTIVQAKET
mmetsp:Transcript_15531/g.17906  ORF Transcript_15531/g.17906 Transcript_15531/m.17906 type:complete len:586 (+) Transcript_15531:46-1803(+)